ncbi:MAG: hypothetical protein QG625_2231 [Cyanobacteriota bacterium erpe_2018_sw_39hr_WHONDRS-SW48-000098_B_bin.30]|jgi:hypothetical protein|nr:hypothetical protein [Candidatus Obscuribacter sp.]MBK7839847.1 hypothetical protein [Candidatus Obscuribacter sp.]MBK9621505.1 hypothetical protein [Candidatus Obscuribacter sp.]MDQ5966076.1 hypothetical protein [Cyanobacteriota bacterium erpe_2018_sw_39hr_WHONDRS-SW48-000098_B_bin.30]
MSFTSHAELLEAYTNAAKLAEQTRVSAIKQASECDAAEHLRRGKARLQAKRLAEEHSKSLLAPIQSSYDDALEPYRDKLAQDLLPHSERYRSALSAASTQMAAAQRQIKPANGPQLLSQPEADAWQIAMEAIGATYEEARRAAEQIYEEARASHSAQFEVTTREISEDFLKRKGQIVNDLHAKLRLIDQEHERDLTTLAVQYQERVKAIEAAHIESRIKRLAAWQSYVESRDNLVKVLSGSQ